MRKSQQEINEQITDILEGVAESLRRLSADVAELQRRVGLLERSERPRRHHGHPAACDEWDTGYNGFETDRLVEVATRVREAAGAVVDLFGS